MYTVCTTVKAAPMKWNMLNEYWRRIFSKHRRMKPSLTQSSQKQFALGIRSHEHSSALASSAPRNISNWRFFCSSVANPTPLPKRRRALAASASNETSTELSENYFAVLPETKKDSRASEREKFPNDWSSGIRLNPPEVPSERCIVSHRENNSPGIV